LLIQVNVCYLFNEEEYRFGGCKIAGQLPLPDLLDFNAE